MTPNMRKTLEEHGQLPRAPECIKIERYKQMMTPEDIESYIDSWLELIETGN